MGIQLHESQIRMSFGHSGDSSGADGMFAAQHQRLELKVKDLGRGVMYSRHHWFGGSEWDLDRSEVDVGHGLKVLVELGTVGLKACAHFPHR